MKIEVYNSDGVLKHVFVEDGGINVEVMDCGVVRLWRATQYVSQDKLQLETIQDLIAVVPPGHGYILVQKP